MSEPEGQELQDKLVTIWYVMDQYQREWSSGMIKREN